MRKLLAYLVAAALLVAAGPTFVTSQALAGIALISGGQCTNSNCIAQGSAASGSNTVTSSASTVDVPVGSFVFINASNRGSSAGYDVACTDTAGNSYPLSATKAQTSQSQTWAFAITTIDAPIGTTWTCHTIFTNNHGIQVVAFSGVNTSSPLDAASATPTSGSGTVQSIGPTGTLSCPGGGANCEVLIAAWSHHSMGVQSAQTAGFTNFGCNTTNSANQCMAYEIVSATTAQSYTSTNSNSDSWVMMLDGFVAATGGGVTTPCPVIGSGVTC